MSYRSGPASVTQSIEVLLEAGDVRTGSTGSENSWHKDDWMDFLGTTSWPTCRIGEGHCEGLPIGSLADCRWPTGSMSRLTSVFVWSRDKATAWSEGPNAPVDLESDCTRFGRPTISYPQVTGARPTTHTTQIHPLQPPNRNGGQTKSSWTFRSGRFSSGIGYTQRIARPLAILTSCP